MINCDYLYEKKRFFNQINKKHFLETKELSYKIFHDAYLVPDIFDCPLFDSPAGVYDCHEVYVPQTYITSRDSKSKKIAVNLEAETNATIENTVVYLGAFFARWGHHITNHIRRCWFLNNEICSQKSTQFAYIPSFDLRNKEMFEAMKLSLEIIGVDFKRLIPITKVTKCRTLIVPEACFYWDERRESYCFTNHYRQLIKKIKRYQQDHFVKDESCEKLYFTYAKFRKGKQFGEQKLENFFQDHGYRVVAPEEYSLKQQLNMLANCREFASTIGSCSHNMIFLSRGSRIIHIPRTYRLTFYQEALNEIDDFQIYYVDTSLSILTNKSSSVQGPFYYFLSKNLLSLFGYTTKESNSLCEDSLADLDAYLAMRKGLGTRACFPPRYYMKQFIRYAGFGRFLLLIPMFIVGKIVFIINRIQYRIFLKKPREITLSV